ncbi:MAG: phosphoribosyltransferase [Thermoprotei archaeon]
MSSSTLQMEYISWKKLVLALVEIASKIKNDNYKPDIIFGILKGGIIPARILSDLLEVGEIGFIGVRFYKKIGTREARPELTLPPTHSVKGLNVLVVDDIVDSGRTLQLVLDELNRYGPASLKSATIYVKKWSPIFPDYYYGITNKWVVFPWEFVETIREAGDIENIVIEDRDLYYAIKNLVEK